jgi:hypothetical protein
LTFVFYLLFFKFYFQVHSKFQLISTSFHKFPVFILLAVLVLVVGSFLPKNALAATAVSCSKVEYKAGNNTTCQMSSGDEAQFWNDDKIFYGVFWFVDVPQAARDYNWPLIQATEAGQMRYWLGTVGNHINPSFVQRVTGKNLIATGYPPQAVPVTNFKVAANTTNNVLVVVQRIDVIANTEVLNTTEGEATRASTNVEFTIPTGEQATISVKTSGQSITTRLFTLTFLRNGVPVTTDKQGFKLSVLWNFADGKTQTESIDTEVQHSYSGTGSFKVTAAFTIDDKQVTASTDVKIDTSAEPKGPNEISAAQTLGGFLLSTVNIVLGIITGIIRWIIWALGSLIFVPLLETTLSIEASNITATIVTGWTYVRDLVNMLFILVLIIIGFGTMLRLESYSYKKLLVNLIMMALLVNFSLVIGRIIIQIADTAQFTFLPQSEGVSGVKDLFAKLSTVHVLSIFDGLKGFTLSGNEALAQTFSLIFQLVLELGVILTFGALAIFMLIRTVALYILLIISPFAYALNVLPATAGMAKQWWSTFLKYAFFAPIIAFFLSLTVKLYDGAFKIFPASGTFSPSFEQLNANFGNYISQLGSSGGTVDFATTLQLLMIYVVILAFMWAGLIATRQMGIFGANAIVGLAEKGLKAPFAYAGKGLKVGLKTGGGALVGFAGRAYSRWTTKKMIAAQDSGKRGQAALWRAAQFVNLRVAGEAWKARSEEKEKEAYLPAVGHVRDSLNRILPTEWHKDKEGKLRLGQKTYYGRIGQRQLINFKTKQWEEAQLSEEEKVKAYNGVHSAEDKEALDTVLMLNRHEDGRAIITAQEKRRKREDELTEQFIGQGEKSEVARAKASAQAKMEIPAQYDAVDDLDTVTEDLKRAGLTSEQIGAIQAHRDEVAEAERKIRGIGNAVYEYDGNFRAANDMSGYGKMEKEVGTTEMLKSLKETGVFDLDKITYKTLVDKDGKTILDEKGKAIQVPVELDFKGQKITDFASLDKAMKETIEKKDAQGNVISGSKAEGENLKYELTGARKQQSAQKRMERGDTELWGAAIEPASYMVQDEDTNFSRFTSYGKRSYKNLSTLVVNSFRKGRRLQARAAKIAGLKKDEKTGQIDAIATDYKVMAEAFTLNEDMTNAIVEKAELDDKIADNMVIELNKQLVLLKSTKKAVSIKGPKEGTKSIKLE